MSSSSSAPDYHSTSVQSTSRRRRRRSRNLEPTAQLPQPLPFCDGFELLRLDPTKVSSSSQSSSAGSRQQPNIAVTAAKAATAPNHGKNTTTSGSTTTANVVLDHVRSLLSCAGVVDYTAARPNFHNHPHEEDQNEEFEPDEYNLPNNDRMHHPITHKQLTCSHQMNPRENAEAVPPPPPQHSVHEYYYHCYNARPSEDDCISRRNVNDHEVRDDTLYCGDTSASARQRNPYWNPTTTCPPMAAGRFSSHYPFSSSATVASRLEQLTASIHNLQRIALTGPHGHPLYGACRLNQGQMLPPAGRWKFTLAAPTSIVLPAVVSPLSTTHQVSKEVRLSAPELLSCELRIGDHCALPLFPPQSSVTLFEYDQQAHTLTVTIAPAQSATATATTSDGWSPRSKESSSSQHSHQQLAVIAVLHPVSKRYCQAVGLTQSGHVAVLHRVCDLLDEWAPTACFTIWSLGIPSTLLSETLVANILALPIDASGLDPNHPPTSVR
jgi:hypothetical protein